MGSWFSKWSSPSGKVVNLAKAKEGCSKPITDPHILKQYEDHIYGIELTSTKVSKQEIVYHPITQIGSMTVI